MLRAFAIIITFLISHAVYAASIKPQVPPQENAVYMDMLKTNPTAAKAYLITREYVSVCRQVAENPKLAIDLPDEPDGFDSKYITTAESKMMKDVIQKAINAYFDKKSRL